MSAVESRPKRAESSQAPNPSRDIVLDDFLAEVRALWEAQLRLLAPGARARLRQQLQAGEAAVDFHLVLPSLEWRATATAPGRPGDGRLPGACLTSVLGADGARRLVDAAGPLVAAVLNQLELAVREQLGRALEQPGARLVLHAMELAGEGVIDLALALPARARVAVGQVRYAASSWASVAPDVSLIDETEN